MSSLNDLLRKFRADSLCVALDGIPDDRVLYELQQVTIRHREITFENYGASLDEAIVMAAAHRIAYGEMFKLASQVAIAKGQPFQQHQGDWLDTTPFGHRLKELRIDSPHIGAMTVGGAYGFYD